MKLLTTEQAADLVGRSLRTIKRWVSAGWLEPLEVDGRRHLYLDTDVYQAERRARTGR